MKLEKIQQDFIAAIFNTDRETALEHIEGDENLGAHQRLGIYRGSVHGILTQSIGDTFPVCKALVGEDFFDKMCDLFIDEYPPTTAFFSRYGDKFPLFLSSFKPLSTIPYIKDVAAFEWSRHTLWQKQSSEHFDFSIIETLDDAQQAKIVFHLSPTLHLIHSKYRIDLIWFAHQNHSDIKLEDIDIETEINLLMWKSKDSIKIANYENDNLEVGESSSENTIDNGSSNLHYWHFLKAISNNSNITDLATEFGSDFPNLLNRSIEDGWIDSFTCD